MNQRPKCKVRPYKIPKRKAQAEHSDINRSKILLDSPSRVMKIKTTINKWDVIKSFCTTREKLSQNEQTAHRMGE